MKEPTANFPALTTRPGSNTGVVYTLRGAAARPDRGARGPRNVTGLSESHISPRGKNLNKTNRFDYQGVPWLQQQAQRIGQATVEFWRGGRLVKVRRETGRVAGSGGKRSTCKVFSKGARWRFMQRLAMTRTTQIPLFVTLTYPDQFPADRHVWKRDLDVFLKRLRRLHPNAAGFWRLELKERLSGENAGKIAPHFHLLLWGVPWEWHDPKAREHQQEWSLFRNYDVLPGRFLAREEVWNGEHLESLTDGNFAYTWDGQPADVYVTTKTRRDGVTLTTKQFWVRDERCQVDLHQGAAGAVDSPVTFLEWISWAWYEVVGSEDPRHLKAGTRVEPIRSPQGVMWYASKYVAKEDETEAGEVGRCWGTFNADKIPWAELERHEVTHPQTVKLLRSARHFVKNSRGRRVKRHLQTWFCDADRWCERLPHLVGAG